MAQGLIRSDKTRDGIAAVLAVNLAELEDQMYERQQQWTAEQAAFAGMQTELEQAGLRILNRPNLLKQNWWTQRNMPSSTVVSETLTVPIEDATAAAAALTYTVTDENITSNYVLHFIKSSDYTVVSSSMVSATFAAGSATITIAARSGSHSSAVTVTVYLCTVASANVLYGNVNRISGTTYPYMKSINQGNYPGDDAADGIAESVVALTGNGVITEPDGESYDKVIQYAITANSAYGNTEWLMYYSPSGSTTHKTTDTIVRNWGQIEEMIPGEVYTVACWVKVVSGDGVWMRFGYGNSYSNAPYNDTTNHRTGISDIIQVDPNGNAWQRVSWTFTFNPSGDWYTETSATSNGVTTVTRTYNWFKKVCFGVLRKYTATVQICGFRLVRGRLFICETYDDLDEDLTVTKGRVTALEAAVAALGLANGQSF